MLTVKSPVFAGKFYPSDKIELENTLKKLFDNTKKDYEITTRAIIVPHAAYQYSGQAAANAFQYLNPSVKNVFIIAPAHYSNFSGIALSSYDYWSTPLGNIKLNREIIDELTKYEKINIMDEAFSQEHAIEVELPLLQTKLPDAQIIPLLFENFSYEKIADIISQYWDNQENGFIISTDLSHFYSQKDAEKIDLYTANMIETMDISSFHPAQACGSNGLLGLVQFTKDKNFALIRVELTTSGEIGGSDASVVGYGSWIMAEENKSQFLKNHFSKLIIDICKESIHSGILTGNSLDTDSKDYPQVLYELGASFVTITLNGNLRGCMGSIYASKPLLNDLAQNAYKSAFADSRFSALTEQEFDKIKIAVSLLSEPRELTFSSEEELLSLLQPNIDGLIITDKGYSAVYLPSVWEQLPDKKDFLNSLKEKAGLKAEHFSPTFKAYKFNAEYIKED